MLFHLSLLALLATQTAVPQQSQKTTEPTATNPAAETAPTLLRIHRICVESFGDDPLSRQLNAMVTNALTESKRFTITEKCEKADATLKGVSTELLHQEAHSSSEETSVGGSNERRSGHVGIADSAHSTETINDVHVAVRLVDKESGDVIWATTQESNGAKYKGAAADAADKVVKRLTWDIEKLEKTRDSAKKPPAD